MNDYFADAFQSLADVAGHDVTYRRGSQWTKVNAVVGNSNRTSQDNDGYVVQFSSRDYLIAVCDLAFGDTAFLPKPGDTITDQNGATFIVSRPDDTIDQVYRFSDHGRAVVRVHTKEKP